MNIEQIMPNDRVRVTLPATSSSQAGIEAEVTVVRVGKEKTAIVVRMANGQLKTLPIANVKEKLGVATANVKPAMGEAAVLAVFEAKHGTAEEPQGQPDEVPAPQAETKVESLKVPEVPRDKQKPIKETKVEPSKKPAKAATKAADIMEQADAMSQDAEEKLKKLKPTRTKKEKVAKAPGVGKPRLTKEELEQRKINIKKDVDEGILTNKEIAAKYNVDAAIVSNARTGYIRYKSKA